jgi:FkbH-like protein
VQHLAAYLVSHGDWIETEPVAGIGTIDATMMQHRTIALTATFTAEPVKESLAFWMEELDLPFTIEFAPYNQVFQQLLDPSSLLSNNRKGINVILVRLEDWLRLQDGDKADADTGHDVCEKVERNALDLALALKSAASDSTTPLLVCLCPVSRAAAADSELISCFRQVEELMISELGGVSGVYLSTTPDLVATYPVVAYDNPHGDKLGHVPYTQAFFAALGTFIARRIHALQNAPHKVIVLDCDQTLWKGVCGEIGAQAIEIDPPRKALQGFVVKQHDAGMLVCLCSKNNEEDVANVFEQRSEMPLRRDHIVSWRINWRAKSENIKSLAAELQLGMDSFVFIDDDPLACAEVQATCPEVLVLQLPQELNQLPQFLDHVWAFDRLLITGEDEKRTALYRQNIERQHFRKESLSFADFLHSLDLKIQISELTPDYLNRVSQLTQRTNQFNCSTIRRSENEIRNLCQAGKSDCLVVDVSDRFGDYGLVGAIIFQVGAEAINVDTFLLSCRALGRGVEHRMLARLGEIARERGLGRINIIFVASGKNQPALDFLEEVGTKFKQAIAGGYRFEFPAEFVGTLTYRPGSGEPTTASHHSDKRSAVPAVHAGPGPRTRSAVLSRIATELRTADQVLKVLESQKKRTRPEQGTFAPPRTPLEEAITEIWTAVLSLDRVSIHDNFFELGGHSLLATVLLSRVQDAFDAELSLDSFFDAPTVAGLAGMVERCQIEQADKGGITELLKELDGLSDDEVKALLASEGQLLQESESDTPDGRP